MTPWTRLATLASVTLIVGAALPFAWLAGQQAEAPEASWTPGDESLLPAEEDPWRLLEARGEVTLRTAKGRILLPFELMPELRELFHGFDENDQAALAHPSAVIRAYAVAHLLIDLPRQLALVRPLLADDTPLSVSAEVGGAPRVVALNALVVELLCAVAAGEADETAEASRAARRLLTRVRRDPRLLAVRDAVRGCVDADGEGFSGLRLVPHDWAAGAVTLLRRAWRDGLAR